MRPSSRRAVIDTNLIVSRLINREGTIGRAYDSLFHSSILLASHETIAELWRVGLRPNLERCAGLAERAEAIELYARTVGIVAIDRPVRDCRDPKDNKFLEGGLMRHCRLHRYPRQGTSPLWTTITVTSTFVFSTVTSVERLLASKYISCCR
jgi:putative PIN family toxin of toxin-antitoxin system